MPTPPGRIIAENYEVTAELGSGGMSTVYLANDLSLNRQIAVKLLHQFGIDSTSIQRFEREAKALSLLVHPNIVRLFRFGFLEDGSPFLAMEFAKGESLRALINRSKTLACYQAVELALQICTALEYAHSQQIIHRDIKPENIVVTKLGEESDRIICYLFCRQAFCATQGSM